MCVQMFATVYVHVCAQELYVHRSRCMNGYVCVRPSKYVYAHICAQVFICVFIGMCTCVNAWVYEYACVYE